MNQDLLKIEVYDYYQLSDDAKKLAYNYWRKNADYKNRDAMVASFNAFCKRFPVEMIDSFVLKNNQPYIQWKFTGDDSLRSMDGTMLKQYLLAHYAGLLFTGEGERDICPLTGYYADYMILNPIYEFISDPSAYNYDYELLLDTCVDAWCVLCNKDLTEFYGMDSFLNECKINGYMFLKNGRMF